MYLFYYQQDISVSLHLVDWIFYLLFTNSLKIFPVGKVLNNEHFLIIHGKSILPISITDHS